jgi:cell wall-associated NlpC family hydrolase
MSFSTPARSSLRPRRITLGLGLVTAAVTAFAAAPSVALASPSSGHPVQAHSTGHPVQAPSHRRTSKSHRTTHHRSAAQRRALAHRHAVHAFNARAHHVIKEASKQRGKPYVYGGAGPHSFDCSGLVMYVFSHALHKSLPHNAAEQYGVSKHITRKQLRPGDLVFVDDGGISHVGIFAGHHHWWVAPHTGTHVQLQRIYSAHFVYGRVIHMNKAGYHRG